MASTNLARRGAAGRGPRPRRRRRLRRLPDRAQGGGDRHRGAPGRGPRAPAWSSCATGRWARIERARQPVRGCGPIAARRSSSTRATACPTRKGLMAQSLSAIGAVAGALVRARPDGRAPAGGARGGPRWTWRRCTRVTEEVLLAEEGEAAVRRFRRWRRLDRLERPLVVLIGGTTGRGQVHARDDAGRPAGDQPRDRHRRDPPGAARLLHRRGDADRAPLGLRGGRDRGLRATRPSDVATGIAAIVERAANEAKPMVVEGVHVVPGGARPATCASAACSWRRSWWSRTRSCTAATSRLRPGTRPAERYLAALRRDPPAAGPPLRSGPARRAWP